MQQREFIFNVQLLLLFVHVKLSVESINQSRRRFQNNICFVEADYHTIITEIESDSIKSQVFLVKCCSAATVNMWGLTVEGAWRKQISASHTKHL